MAATKKKAAKLFKEHHLPNEPTNSDVLGALEEMARDEPKSLRYVAKQNKKTKQWRWKLLSANHKSIAISGESYVNKADCLSAIRLVMASGDAGVEVED
jgi:uncharacterized protein